MDGQSRNIAACVTCGGFADVKFHGGAHGPFFACSQVCADRHLSPVSRNDLTPAEQERLAVMIEEARRLQGACNQALTHGLVPRAQQDLTIALLRLLAVKDAMKAGGDLVCDIAAGQRGHGQPQKDHTHGIVRACLALLCAELRRAVERQPLLLETEGALCQADGGECLG